MDGSNIFVIIYVITEKYHIYLSCDRGQIFLFLLVPQLGEKARKKTLVRTKVNIITFGLELSGRMKKGQ